ncbi:MAG: YlbF family regulator [Syntrophomonadaceae bacterium]|jgi:cell fate (sporulation/competence/biofilm development) regulator YlbF (YheA/YmcA/DUF963 family)
MTSLNPYDQAYALARSITESEVYNKYVEAKKVLDSNPDTKERVLKLREQQMEINKAQALGENPSGDKVREVTLEFARLNREEIAEQFFSAEASFVRMFADIQEIIQKEIEKDLK